MKIFLLLFLFCMSVTQAQVWPNENSWNQDWENKYSQWVKNNWTVDFFSRAYLPNGAPNEYYGFKKDCADVVYSMRVIFSYENKLPFVMNDPTGGSKFISNQMTRFNRTSNPKTRAHEFMEYLNKMVSTRSLPNDTYPVAVTRSTVRSGGLMMATPINHHSWTIKEILPIGVPWLVYSSTIGKDSGSLLKERQSWPNPAWVFEGDQSPAGHAGFRDWKPVKLISQPAWKIPGYSDEQYRIPLQDWRKWAQERLAVQSEVNEKMIQRLTRTVCEGLSTRVIAVNEGVDYIRQNPRCMNYETYDIYSTPNRDERLFDDLIALRSAYRDILIADESLSLDPLTNKQLSKIFPYAERSTREEAQRMPRQIVDEYSLCPIEYSEGKVMDLSEAKRRLFLGLFSNNPHDEIQYRWGDEKGSSSLTKQCRSWDPWSPNLDRR